jgi:hypothetical protein
MPTEEDGHRLRIVARHHRAQQVLLATWKKGTAAPPRSRTCAKCQANVLLTLTRTS